MNTVLMFVIMGVVCAAMRGCMRTCFNGIPSCAKQAAWDSRVQICIENCILEMPLSRQLVQIIGRNKFSIRFESLCWILKVSPRLEQVKIRPNQTTKAVLLERGILLSKTRAGVLFLAKYQAGRQFEVIELASLESIYIYL